MNRPYNREFQLLQNSDDVKIFSVEDVFKKSSSRAGVLFLLHKYETRFTSELISRLYLGKYTSEEDIPLGIRRRDEYKIAAIKEQVYNAISSLTASEGRISEYIELTPVQIKNVAVLLAERYYQSASEKVNASQEILGSEIPGDTLNSKFSRCCSAAFWRRALNVRIARAKEQLFLRLGMVGTRFEKYASDSAIDTRELQLRSQQKWMNNTFLVSKEKEDTVQATENYIKIPLVNVVQGPEARFAKLYSFVKAMEILGEESKLNSAMLTITLEPEWHPNPSHGVKQWNGRSPREAHQSFCKRWQAIVRDLHRRNIRISGLRVVEPHGDACPHYHIWLLYRPEYETKIMRAIMQYFPNRLKVTSADRLSDGEVVHDQIIYKSRKHLVLETPWPCSLKTRAQVVFAKINPAVSKGASYVTKYLMMTLPANFEKISNGKSDSADGSSKGASLPRVDSYRSIWGLSRGQLFGVAKCLTVWDQLRKMSTAPENSILRDLWEKARGGTEEGRIGKGEGQRGNALAFLKALGGLDAARHVKQNAERLALARLVEYGENRHGDRIEKTVGIVLLKKERLKICSKRKKKDAGRAAWKIVTSIVASIRTKLKKWEFLTMHPLSSKRWCIFQSSHS
jgi:hypothetical protein